MCDHETAAIGIEASLTGHLVFSTLHTNSAPETISRLLDMNIDPFNFADALLGIMAQRLIRTLCPKCKEPHHPSEEDFDELMEIYASSIRPGSSSTSRRVARIATTPATKDAWACTSCSPARTK